MNICKRIVMKLINLIGITCDDSSTALAECNSNKIKLQKDYDSVKRLNTFYANDIIDLNEIINDNNITIRNKNEQIINLQNMIETISNIHHKPIDEKIIWALEGINVNAESWKEVNDITRQIFKVDIETFMVDMDGYRNFFNVEIFPSILENNGAFRFEDWNHMRGCNIDDFIKVLVRDPTDKLNHEADLNDCEDFIRTVKTNCQQIYGLTNVRTIYGKHNDKRHAFGAVYTGFNEMWIFEPQTDNIWRYNSTTVPIELVVSGWYDYR